MTVLLAIAYALVAALLLYLGLASRWTVSVKVAAIVLVTGFYGVTYAGLRAMEGWPTAEPVLEEFRLHWVTVDEPDKRSGQGGAIYLWIRGLDASGRQEGEPRAHRLAYDERAARQANEALAALQGGRRLNGRLTRGRIDPAASAQTEDAEESSASRGSPVEDDLRWRFEFRDVPTPQLPAKPPVL